MVLLKTKEEIATIQASATILSKVHGELAYLVKPGISTIELDEKAEALIRKMGGEPAFKGYQGFPATLCISVNEEVVHTPPSNRQLQSGDIVTIDAGVYYQGFYSDSAFTYGVGNVPKELLNLVAVTETALYKGIEQACLGNTIGDIGHAIQSYVEENNHSIVRDYTGHGIGRNLHEAPSIPNHGMPGEGMAIQEGMVIAIEPIVNLGKGQVYMRDQWTVCTKDGKPSAHFEHTIAIVGGKPKLLSTFDYIKSALKT